jgi:hypothetical protein
MIIQSKKLLQIIYLHYQCGFLNQQKQSWLIRENQWSKHNPNSRHIGIRNPKGRLQFPEPCTNTFQHTVEV